jgi:hypothetical protein
MIEPPYRTTLGRFMRTAAIAAAGMVLSQPTMNRIASSECPRTASSAESAITSRLISDARIPLVPIASPSVTTIVLNSIGVPPASSIPRAACCARSRKCMLHGVTVEKLCTMAISGLASALSSNPAAWNIARAGALAGPSTISRDGSPFEVIENTCSFLDTMAPLKHDRAAVKRGESRYSRVFCTCAGCGNAA